MWHGLRSPAERLLSWSLSLTALQIVHTCSILGLGWWWPGAQPLIVINFSTLMLSQMCVMYLITLLEYSLKPCVTILHRSLVLGCGRVTESLSKRFWKMCLLGLGKSQMNNELQVSLTTVTCVLPRSCTAGFALDWTCGQGTVPGTAWLTFETVG